MFCQFIVLTKGGGKDLGVDAGQGYKGVVVWKVMESQVD